MSLKENKKGKRSLIDRFNSFVRINPENGCHEFNGHLNKKGYGCFQAKSHKSSLAHRFIWSYVKGPIPEGKYILHHCDNRKCVNIDHLYVGTQLDNMRDMRNRGRSNYARGEQSGVSKLVADQVKRIKGLLAIGLQPTLISKCTGNTHASISDIKRGKTWSHVSVSIVGQKTHQGKSNSRLPKNTMSVVMLSADNVPIKTFNSIISAAKFIGRTPRGFQDVINGKQSTWGGYKWAYHNQKTKRENK